MLPPALSLRNRHPGTLEGMLDRLAVLEKEYETVLIQLSDPAVISDQRRLREASRRHKELEPVVAAYREYGRVAGDLGTAREMMADLAAAAGTATTPGPGSATTPGPSPGRRSGARCQPHRVDRSGRRPGHAAPRDRDGRGPPR